MNEVILLSFISFTFAANGRDCTVNGQNELLKSFKKKSTRLV